MVLQVVDVNAGGYTHGRISSSHGRVIQVVRPTTRAFRIGVKIPARFFPLKPKKQMHSNYGFCGACLTAAARWASDAPQPSWGPSYVARVGRNIAQLVPRDRQD